MCAGYKRRKHQAPASILVNGKRVNNIQVDHIDPVVDPAKGFENWHTYIERMFCEADGLQVLCRECHQKKTDDEKKRKKK